LSTFWIRVTNLGTLELKTRRIFFATGSTNHAVV
jgi:hypothetical protein